jgi:hypothetical protein
VHLSHLDYSADDCVYTTNASGSWATEIVDIYGGKYTSIGLDSSGGIHISYGSQNGLEHATKVGGSWVETVIDPGGRQGESALVVDGSDHVHIVYEVYGISYATNASGSWVTEVIDDTGPRSWMAIARDPADDLHVSYYDVTTYVLRYAATGKIERYGCGTNPPDSLVAVEGAPALGSTVTVGVDNPLSTQGWGSIPLVAVSFSPDPNYPCGTLVPNWGMTAPGAMGELLIGIVAPDPAALLVGAPWTYAGYAAPVDLPIPPIPMLVGMTAYVQGILFDSAATYGIKFGLTEAFELHIEL